MPSTIQYLGTIRQDILAFRGESNFLILYYFYEGLKSQGDLKTYGLSAKGTYRILPKFSGYDSGKSSEQYQSLISAFKILELSEGEVDSAFKILAAILETSELQFITDSQGIKIQNEDTAKNGECDSGRWTFLVLRNYDFHFSVY